MIFKGLARHFGRIDCSDGATVRDRGTRFSEAGDTLVEVLLAVIVLGLASVALIIAFSTSISASAEHRQLATSDILLSTVSQEAISVIESNANLNLFTACNPQSTYVSDLSAVFTGTVTTQSGITYTPALATNTGTIYGVQWWDPATASFISPCTQGVNTDQPQLITVQVTYNGKVYYNSFVVDYPLASVSAQTSTGVAAQLVFTTDPSATAFTSIPFTQQPVLEIEDANGNAVTTDLSPVIISIASGTAGQLSGCSGSELDGVISFSGCELDQAGTYILTATDGSLTSTTNVTVTVTGSSTPYIKFTTQPTGGASGSTFSREPVIKVMVGASVDTAWSGTITLSTSGGLFAPSSCTSFVVTKGNTAGTALSSSCLFSGGIFYDPVSGQTLAVPYTMTATAAGLIPATSSTFIVSGPGPATQLDFVTEPGGVASATATAVFPTQPVVDIEDDYGNVVTSSSATVSLSGTGIAGCTSTTTKGVATFSGCHGTAYGTGFVATATSSSLSEDSTPFNVTGVAASMQFTTQPVAGNSGATLATQPVLTIYDSSGRIVTASTAPITLSTSGGSLTFCTNLTPFQGLVKVNTCNFAGIVGTQYTMTAVQGSISVTSNPFSPIAPGVATQLFIVTQPVAGASQSAFTTQPVIDVEDSAGNLVVNSAATLQTPTASGGILAGCTNLTAVTGVVSLANCTFAGVVGTPYFMTVSANGLGTTNSATFSPNAAGPIDQIILTGCTSNIQWNANCTATATIEDVFANILLTSNSGVTFTQVSGTGAVTGLGTINASNGIANVTLTGSVVGALQINATSTAVTSNSLTITVVGIPQTVAFYTTNGYTVATVSGTTTYGPSATYQTNAQGSGAGIITFASSTPSICTIDGGTGLVTTVGAGTCNLTADAGPTPHYADSGTTGFTLTILKAANAITITSGAPGGAVVGGATYTPTASATSGDSVVIASTTTTVCTISGGVVRFLSVGTCTLNFSDAGNANYTVATPVQQSFTVSKGAPANVVTNGATPALGGSVTFTATVSGPTGGATPTGAVNWSVSGTASITTCTSSTTTLSGSGNTATATCTITASKAGTIIVSDSYGGDTNYSTLVSSTDTVTIGKATPTNVVTDSSPTVFGNSVTFTATVTGPAAGATPSGGVTWVVSGTSTISACSTSTTTLSGSGNSATATCTITVSKAGTIIVSDSYAGDSNYFTVASATDTMRGTPAVLVTNNAVSTGGTLIFTATVTGPPGGVTPTGVLGWAISGGAAACTSSTGPTGASNVATYTCSITNARASNTYSATATYPGDSKYPPASGSDIGATVGTFTPTVHVTNSAVGTGGNLVFTATVTGPAGVITPTGTMVWTISGGASACSSTTGPTGATNVATYTCTVNSAQASGTYSATATYPGDGNYDTAAGSDNGVTVTKVTPSNVVTNSGAPTVGSSVTFTATITGPANAVTPSSTVAWTVGGTAGTTLCTSSTTTLSGSGNVATATCTVNAPKPGTITASDVYAGDTNYNTVTSAASSVTVAKATPTNIVTNDIVPAVGGSVTFTATVSGAAAGPTPTGTLTWTVTGVATVCTTSTTTLSGSGNTATAMCTVSGVKQAGAMSAKAAYVGDTNYNAVTSTDSITTTQGTPVVNLINNSVSTGGTLMFTVTVTAPAGSIGPTGTMGWAISGGAAACNTKTGPTTVSNVTTYSCNITNVLAANTYSATATYPGDTNYFGGSDSDNGVTVTQASQVPVTVASISGNVATPLTLADAGGSGTGADSYTVTNGTATNCDVSGAGPYTLSASTAGTCMVTAKSAGDANYLVAYSSPTTVTLFGTRYWSGTSFNSTTVKSPTFTAPTSEGVVILIAAEGSSAKNCGLPADSGLTVSSLIATSTYYNPSGYYYRMCAYSAQGLGTSGLVSESFSGTMTSLSIQVVEVTGDNSAVFLASKFISGTSSTPTFQLTAATTGYSEILFGALANGATPPTWSAITNFTNLGNLAPGSSPYEYSASVYFGAPASLSVVGGASGSSKWGTIGIEVQP